MRLSELCDRLGGERRGSADPELVDVHIDSRRVGPNQMFCALPGLSADGARFVGAAIEGRAAAVLAPRALEVPGLAGDGVPLWIHPEARRITGEAAAQVHGHPALRQGLVGVTGTNGKTTVVHLVTALLRATGHHPGTVGTIEVAPFGAAPRPATHTTPDAAELQRLLAENLLAGGDHLVLEASSHALDQERLAGLELDVAVFTNLTPDHLDYHADMDAYAAAKALLFPYLKAGGAAVVSAAGPYAARMLASARASAERVVTFGLAQELTTGADLVATVVEAGPRGSELEVSGMGLEARALYLPLPGRHNVENALAALASVLLLGVDRERALLAFGELGAPRGRLEQVPTKGRHGFQVFVDYAHTPDALERVLRTLRELMDLAHGAADDDHALFEGRLICVFGCGGDRDQDKRAPMGEVVGSLADLAVVTSDNPRHEDPDAIIAQIREGLGRTPVDVLVEPDRRAAIRRALRAAQPGDVVLVAGKGHEAWQLSRGKRTPFEDRRVISEELP